MTYFFKLYIYDKAEWAERGSHLRHHGLYTSLIQACAACEQDIQYDNRYDLTYPFKNHVFIVPPLPEGVVNETSIWDKVHFFETESTLYDIYCFKLICYSLLSTVLTQSAR